MDPKGWLSAHGRAWERKDVDDFVRLFSPDVLYYLDALRGRGGKVVALG